MSREALAASGAASLPFAALWLFTFILLVAPQALIPPLAAIRPALVVGVVAIVIHLADRGRRRPPPVPTGLALAGALLAWAVATLPLSYWPGGSVTFLTGLYVKTLALFWLVCEIVNTRRRLARIVWALAVMSAVPAAVTLANYLSGRLRGERVLGYETALGTNPNDIALLLTVLLPLALGLFALERRPAVRVLLAVIVGLDVAAVVITFSRGGFLALLVALALALGPWGRRPRAARGTRAALIVVMLLIALALPGGYLAHMATIGDIDADPTGSAQARWTDMKAAVRFIVTHPFIGSGIGNDILALNEARGPLWKSVHNVYLQYGVDLGLPGLALFVALMVSAVRAARAARRLAEARGDGELAVLARAVQVSLATFAVAGFFSTAGYHFPFYYLAGLAIAARAVAARAVVTAPAPVAPSLGAPVLAGAGAGPGWWRR